MSASQTDGGGLIKENIFKVKRRKSASESAKHSFLDAIIGLMSQNIKMLHGLNEYILQIRDATNEFLYD